MGSIIDAIYDDIDEYEFLCKKYGEEKNMIYDEHGINPYSEHARKLKERARKEILKDKK